MYSETVRKGMLMNKKQKKTLIRIIISAILMIAGIFIPLEGIALFVFYLIPYFIIGYDIYIRKVY